MNILLFSLIVCVVFLVGFLAGAFMNNAAGEESARLNAKGKALPMKLGDRMIRITFADGRTVEWADLGDGAGVWRDVP